MQQCGVLVLHRSMRKVLAVKQAVSGKWGLPKGHVPRSEGEWYGALRELYEETGLRLDMHPYHYIGRMRLRGRVFFVVHLHENAGTFRPVDKKEIERVRWIALDRLTEFVKAQPCNMTLVGLEERWRRHQGLFTSAVAPAPPEPAPQYYSGVFIETAWGALLPLVPPTHILVY